jgi:hypothetical protein
VLLLKLNKSYFEFGLGLGLEFGLGLGFEIGRMELKQKEGKKLKIQYNTKATTTTNIYIKYNTKIKKRNTGSIYYFSQKR